MPTRKQKRRREKDRRHEYEYVYVDDAGQEVEVDEPEPAPAARSTNDQKPDAKAKTQSGSRWTKEPPEPSWSRSVRRAVPWQVGIVLVMLLLLRSSPLASRLLIALFYGALFIPLMYLTDRMVRNRWLKQQAKPPAKGPDRRAGKALVRLTRGMALSVDRYELGPIGTNCYVVRTERGAPEAVVVDPGDDPTDLRLEIARMGVTVVGILVTHTHYDHIGAVAELAESTGAPVYISEVEAPVLARPDDYYPGHGIRPWDTVVALSGDEQIDLAGISFETVNVPGHSPGHVAFSADLCLFSGDVLFAGSVGRTDLPMASWDTLVESIRALFDRFPPETVVYSGHGPPTTLGDELARNPFLAELRA